MDAQPPSESEKPIRHRATVVPWEFMTAGVVECRKALDHGLYTAAIVMAYVVADGVLNFVCEKRGKPECSGRANDYLHARAACLHRRGALSDVGLSAVRTLFVSTAERNNFLHFNPAVQTDPGVLRMKAEEKCAALETLLTDLFAYTVNDGVLHGINRELWPGKAQISAALDFTANWEESERRARTQGPPAPPPS